jgi:tRNA dimethylallyltransferase
VGQFEKEAIEKLDELFQRNKVQIMVGGSGLYVDAVLEGFDDFPDVPVEIRKGLVTKLNEQGLEKLQEELKSLDIDSFNTIEIQNPHRIIRALEICIATGEKYSSFKNKKRGQRNFTPVLIGIDADRKVIYQRINDRVDQMMQDGLLDEVRSLFDYRNLNALHTVGYKELFEYFDGKSELDFAISEIKKNSRRYAKRQNTWFKRNNEIQWFDYQSPAEGVIKYINKKLC